MKPEGYIRCCKRCNQLYRSKFKTSKICPECDKDTYKKKGKFMIKKDDNEN